MIIHRINSPKDLKKLDIEELITLSRQVRDHIISVVSQTGGHLASSLGAVEVILALHHCLETPRDTIVFDVGHQAYAHKIITGRRKAFKELRQFMGVSGFPNYQESEYDAYLSGHASTAISWAQGISEAKRLKKQSSKTVALVGDGSLTGGLCFEALNSCGHCQSDLLVVVNHNEMSISPSVGALSSHLTKIISAPIYNRLKDEMESFLEHFSITKRLVQQARKFEETVKGLIVPGAFFEELNFRYFGPIDGHNFDVLIPTLTNVLSLKGPRVLHVVTKKGKGYPPSESNPQAFHGVSLFDVASGKSVPKTMDSFGEAFAKKLTQLAKTNKKIVAITAAMPSGTGLVHFRKRYPRRFYDVGIAEAHAVSFASGLAKQGLKPVVAIYSTFLQRAFDQIIHDVALQKLNVIFAIDRAGLVGEDGPTHHGVFDIGYMRMIPNMVCIAPKDRDELEEALELALSLDSPVSIRYPRGAAVSLELPEPLSLGKAQVIRRGSEVCILALGSMVRVGLDAVKLLEDAGIQAGLVNMRFIKPLDESLLKELVGDYRLIVTIEEGGLACGFGSLIKEFYEANNLLHTLRVISVGFPDEFIAAGKRELLLKLHGLEPHAFSNTIKHTLERIASCQK